MPPTRCALGVCAMTLVALLVAGCSSSGGKQSTPTTTTAGVTVTTAPASVPVSPGCLAAMQRVSGATRAVVGVPSGEAAQVQDSAIVRSLATCRWRDEWLTAARGTLTKFTETSRLALLNRFCEYGLSGRRRAVVLDAPSCVVLSASKIVADPAPCAKTYPSTPLTTLNAGVVGLDRELVPIGALKVRLCSYGPDGLLDGGKGVLTPLAAGHLEVETNGLASFRPPSTGSAGSRCIDGDRSLSTFVGRQQVTLATSGCGVAVTTNGVLYAHPTPKWLTETQALNMKQRQSP